MADQRDSDNRFDPTAASAAERAPWTPPQLKMLDAKSSESTDGANVDANNTLS
jgi:hypothetical protein